MCGGENTSRPANVRTVRQRLGVDPAVASGPLITTVNDLVAVTAYYGLAWLLLIEVLHF